MESNVKILSPEELIPPLLGLLEETDCVPLVISGHSMTPFLAHGRDTVFLSKVQQPLKRGDMILYCRDSGQYVLHRIYQAGSGVFTLVGDAQTLLETGIRRDQVLAMVCMVRRKGKLLKPGSLCWIFFARIWIRLVPLRPRIMTVYARVSRLLRKNNGD